MRTKKKLSILFTATIFTAALLITGTVVRAAEQGDAVTVRITGLSFTPAEITVKPGTRVRWVNEDPFAHDVTSGRVVSGRKARQVKESRLADGKFHSGSYGQGRGFEFVFVKTGSYPYFCTIHPIMTGTVTVVK